jgi:uncharacterized protein involved in exopolysaccharide biosynthesis
MKGDELNFFDLRTLACVVWRAKYLVAICAVSLTVGAFAASYLMTPFYRVTTVVADASEPGGNAGMLSALGQLGSLASLAGIGLESEVRASDEATAVLISDDFLTGFILRHELMPVLYDKQWDSRNGTWNEAEGKPPTMGMAIRYLRSLMTISKDRKTQLISVSVDWKNRNLASRWCDLLIADVNAEMQSRSLARARDRIMYLRKQLEVEASVETRQAVARLLEVQLKQEMLASVSTDFVFKTVSVGVPPDPDRFIRPRRALLAAIGMLFGSALGVLVALVRVRRLPIGS